MEPRPPRALPRDTSRQTLVRASADFFGRRSLGDGRGARIWLFSGGSYGSLVVGEKQVEEAIERELAGAIYDCQS